MQTPEAYPLLDPLGFFPGLGRAILRDVSRNCTQVMVPAGHLLFRHGDPSDSVYTVSTGRLDVSVQRAGKGAASILEVGRGEFVQPDGDAHEPRAVPGRHARRHLWGSNRGGSALHRDTIGVQAQNTVHFHADHGAVFGRPACRGGVVGADGPHGRGIVLRILQDRHDLFHGVCVHNDSRMRSNVAEPVC